MALLTRSTLKNLFRRGNSPTEVNFADFIDSTVNKIDDGFAKNAEDGLQIAPQGGSRKLLSFYDNIRDKNASWTVALGSEKSQSGLSFSDGDNNALFLRDGGNVGIGTDMPMYNLDVNGTAAMRGRIGTFAKGEVPADGNWQTILSGLDGPHAFEVVARLDGAKGRGKYAMTHAIAIATYGKSSWAIKHTRAYFGWWWHGVSLRWTGSVHNYTLQIRSRSHYGLDDYGNPYFIRFHITNLWDDADFTPLPSASSNGAAAVNNISPANNTEVSIDDLGL